MPELLFRRQMSQYMTVAGVLSDFINHQNIIEKQKFFLKNKENNKNSNDDYLYNDLIGKKDIFANSNLFFNSMYFRCCYLMALLTDLARTNEKLLLVSDPITTSHLKEILKVRSQHEKSKLNK